MTFRQLIRAIKRPDRANIGELSLETSIGAS
jgi:hypothetical protein